jgi:hypothetical protein
MELSRRPGKSNTVPTPAATHKTKITTGGNNPAANGQPAMMLKSTACIPFAFVFTGGADILVCIFVPDHQPYRKGKV